MVKKTKVVINSVTVRDDSSTEKKLINWELEEVSERGVATLTMMLPRTVIDDVEITVGKTVEAWGGNITSTDKKYFRGEIVNVKPTGGLLEVTCRDRLYVLVRKNVNKIYFSSEAQAGEGSAIVEDLIETYGGLTAQVVATGTAEGRKIDEFKCLDTDIYERVMALAKAFNYQVWYDATIDKARFEPRGHNDTGYSLVLKTDIIGLPTWEYDKDNLINNIKIEGAMISTDITETGQIGVTSGYTTTSITIDKTPESVELIIDSSNPPTTQREGGSKDGSTGNYYYVDRENKKVIPADTTFITNDYAILNYTWAAPAPIRMKNQTSITDYQEHQTKKSFNDITSIADAEARAIEILARYSLPFISGEFLFKEQASKTLSVGDLINVTDTLSRPNVDGQFVITKLITKFPSPFQEVTAGDKPLRLDDKRAESEERLRRLEENLIRNQDLVVELVNINNESQNNAKKFEPRYRKVSTQDYTTTDNTLIWDNPTHGIWDTDNWATDANPDGFDDEVLFFMQQRENVYTEEFIDEDFKASATTATWSGSVNFTSGQVAQSEPVDYNNGTITTATLTATEVSGSFDYEMTANGSDWESITSNTPHTFSDSGTDLRWRATENAASTGEISEVEISEYH